MLIVGGIVFVVFLIVLVVRAVNRSGDGTVTPTPTPAKQLLDYPSFEGEGVNEPPDIRVERLPDGSRIEYGSYHGRMTPEREAALKELVEKEKKKLQLQTNPTGPQSDASNTILNVVRPKEVFPIVSLLEMTKGLPSVYAAGLSDAIVFEVVTAPQSMVDHLRSLFAARLFYWTDRDLLALDRIHLADSQDTLGGAYGLWDFVRSYNADGSFRDLKGMIWIWKDGPIEQALIHEYGHHYTNYWGAKRTNGAVLYPTFAAWPSNIAGDYYQLRPLRDGCHCASFDVDPVTNQPVCPYDNKVWEILAEDYRATATAFNTGHVFANNNCLPGTSGLIGQPDVPNMAAYMAALPLDPGGAVVATPAVPYPTPTGPPPMCLAVQHCTRGNTVQVETCGDCQGARCLPGYTCLDLTYTCTTYQQKIYGNDVLYPVPCIQLSPTPPPLGAGSDVGINASYFPRIPFVACYDRGGVCTFQDTCLKFSGTTFEKNTTICPTSEGCCIFPNPVPIVRGQIECERDAGVCTSIPAACTMQGGTPVAGKGCTTHCCMFPSNPTSYANRQYRDIMQRVQEGRMSSMAVTAWLENACRTPRLQNVYCDPNIEGDCERIQCTPR